MRFLVFGLLASSLSVVTSDDNGVALSPPMGWRSWNYWGCNISQDTMERNYDALVDRSRKIWGNHLSLRDIGYSDAGVDDCWQVLGMSFGNYTYHDLNGVPQVNKVTFPDMKGMVDYAHKLGLKAGFYGNNCKSKDVRCVEDKCFQEDVKATLAFGFDSIKLDSCGGEKNITKWRDLFNSTSDKPIMIENCHNGFIEESPYGNTPWGKDPSECPFHMYRTSGDIQPYWGHILTNIESVFELADAGLSYPGCWAYPDMLEVGVTDKNGTSFLSYIESRTHFALWSIVSSPLILGMDITNGNTLGGVWDIITNQEMIAVNQAYEGFSGSRYYSSQDITSFEPCMDDPKFHLNCYFPSVQYYYKPQANHTMAVLLVNHGDATTDLVLTFLQIPSLHPAPAYTVRDLYNRIDIGVFSSTTMTFKHIQSRDSVFLLLTPSNHTAATSNEKSTHIYMTTTL